MPGLQYGRPEMSGLKMRTVNSALEKFLIMLTVKENLWAISILKLPFWLDTHQDIVRQGHAAFNGFLCRSCCFEMRL